MKPDHFLKSPVTTSQDLSAGSLSYTTSIGRNFKLESVHIKFSTNVTEKVTITRDSKSGANYDTVLYERQLVGRNSAVFNEKHNFLAGDEIKIEITNANATGIAYVEIRTSEM